MELRTHGLALSVTYGLPDGEGWMHCHALVNVPGFRGDIDFSMLRADLELFRSQLGAAVGGVERPASIRLASTDPGIELSMQIEKTGQIQGSYQFGRGPEHPELSGGFVMDQTFLRPLLVQVDQILTELG